jgi:hypothetical protein
MLQVTRPIQLMLCPFCKGVLSLHLAGSMPDPMWSWSPRMYSAKREPEYTHNVKSNGWQTAWIMSNLVLG